MAIEDKLAVTRFAVDGAPHLRLDAEKCAACPEKPCLYVCPVQNYRLNDGRLELSWQGCLECGACRIACTHGGLDWAYPRGGFGVSWRYG